MSERVSIYTDGSANNNTPSPGGWGAVLSARSKTREISGYVTEVTTSPRMELMAAIEALGALTRPASVELHTDSEYVIKSAKGARVRKNRDLVEQLRGMVAVHDVAFTHVRGHTGDPGNERAHELANAARLEAEGIVRSWEEARLSVPTEYGERFRDWYDDPTRRLYPWIKNDKEDNPPKVNTPRGVGVLIAVLAGEARVLLDNEQETGQYKTGKPFPITRQFPVEQIEPIPFRDLAEDLAVA